VLRFMDPPRTSISRRPLLGGSDVTKTESTYLWPTLDGPRTIDVWMDGCRDLRTRANSAAEKRPTTNDGGQVGASCDIFFGVYVLRFSQKLFVKQFL